MWQRIQTIYLAVTFILTTLMFILPLAQFQTNDTTYTYTAAGLKHIQHSGEEIINEKIVSHDMTVNDDFAIATMMLVVLILVINIIGIGLYKNRIFQIRFNMFNIFLYVGFYALFLLFVWSSSSAIELSRKCTFDICYKIPLAFPIVNIILTYLAIRAIGTDEALVRSYDRIR